jgi:AraC family transcriptional regulator of adaptative response/methylated-DNA-[protein]-cysteine methyltransferase
MTPTSYRAGGSNVEMRVARAECALGSVLVAATERGLCAILLGDDPEALARELDQTFPRARRVAADSAFAELVAKVVRLVEDPRGGSTELPLDIRGTAFQQRVWSALTKIPAGRTMTYEELAAAIGAPGSARAVARACAANTLAVAVPCHRVVRADGAPSGYRWGASRKRALLAREAEALP